MFLSLLLFVKLPSRLVSCFRLTYPLAYKFEHPDIDPFFSLRKPGHELPIFLYDL